MRWRGKRLPYSEGSGIYLPLRCGGFARGVVARLSGKGCMFVYFFGPRLEKPEGSFQNLRAAEAVLVGKCGDLGILNGEWTVAGELEGWNRTEWPLPPLYREDVKSDFAALTYYDDQNLDALSEEIVVPSDEFRKRYPCDSLMGYGATEIKLTRLLA